MQGNIHRKTPGLRITSFQEDIDRMDNDPRWRAILEMSDDEKWSHYYTNAEGMLIYQHPTRIRNDLAVFNVSGFNKYEKDPGGSDKPPWMFITINPPDTLDFKLFMTKVAKFMSSKNIVQGIYAFEQRAEDDSYTGRHVHILLERSSSPAYIMRGLKSNFSKLVGNEKHIKVGYRVGNGVANTEGYILGKKSAADKQSKAANDVHFRIAYGIQPYYIVGPYKLVRPDPIKPEFLLGPEPILKKKFGSLTLIKNQG